MSPETRGKRTRPGQVLGARLILALVVAAAVGAAVGVAVGGCSPQPAPTPTALPIHTPVDAWAGVSPEVRGYLLIVRPVTSDAAIVNARWQTSEVLQALVQEMDLVEPPPEMDAAHALLLEGYQLLAEGTALLETHPDPQLRSEAIFMQDWGQRQLWEHRRAVTEFLGQIEQEQAP